MSALAEKEFGSAEGASSLQEIIAKIQAARSFDEKVNELGQEICDLFRAERITVYALSEDRLALVARVKTGLTSFRDLKLPITEASIAGFAAFHSAKSIG
mgnify:CR=1 FL=1